MIFLSTGIDLRGWIRKSSRHVVRGIAAGLVLVSALIFPNEARTQARDSVDVVLPEVRVTATRGMGAESTSPFS
ncbi:MAG: hypothetical protein O6942_04185, partial [Bacteroidetes bacterium]|nr:hypothetical protein [Bacteroidota bacterium]